MDLLEVDLSLLSIQDEPSGLDYISELDAENTSYASFFADYLFRNRPCLLKNVSQGWTCQKEWVSNGKPNFDWLLEKYGEAEVPVSNCKKRYFNSQSKTTMKLVEFLSYWRGYIEQKHPADLDCYYMKDWHFSNENPSDDVYRVPPFFASDWINEYLLNNPSIDDDYRFVYMGPKGSWTPLHADVFSSFSWSVNICGSKKWVFFPPGQEKLLKDKFGTLAFDVEGDDLTDVSKFPHYSPISKKIVLVQEVGDAIFVPSGWHHQVWNLKCEGDFKCKNISDRLHPYPWGEADQCLNNFKKKEDTISFNHNWVNGCNINKMWDTLNECFKSVTQEIADCKSMDGWDAQCQLVLKSCFGMNHMDFYTFIATVAHSRINCLTKGENLLVNGRWYMGHNHSYFDLTRIHDLLETMIDADLGCYKAHIDEIKLLSTKIDEVVHSYQEQTKWKM